MFVATLDGDVVGGGRLERTGPNRVKLGRLAVAESRKGEGVGSALLDRAGAVVRTGDATTAWLTTPEAHPFLPDLYRRRGYERTDVYPLGYREYDEVVVEKRLP